MSKDTKFTLTLKGGAISINDIEVDSDVAAKVMRLVMPLSAGTQGEADDDEISSTKKDSGVLSKDMTAKQFMATKQPKGDVERITCLAFYLTQYKGTSQFKTIDLTHLNTEAAQPKFSNASVAARNAVNMQYLALAGGGKKQVSPRGESVVNALPNRSAVKEALENNPLHGNKHKGSKKKQKNEK